MDMVVLVILEDQDLVLDLEVDLVQNQVDLEEAQQRLVQLVLEVEAHQVVMAVETIWELALEVEMLQVLEVAQDQVDMAVHLVIKIYIIHYFFNHPIKYFIFRCFWRK